MRTIRKKAGGLRRWAASSIVLTALVGLGLTGVLSSPTAAAGAENCNPPTITSANSATVMVGIPFSFTVTTCTTAVPLIKAAHLPSGLHLFNNDDGTATISGNAASRDGGVFAATVTVSVRGQAVGSQSLAITVDNSPLFKSRTAYIAHSGTLFSYPITTIYGYPIPTITTSSDLPAGVALVDNHNGTASLSGTPGPSAGGVYPISILAANEVAAPATQAFTLTVYQGPTITSAASDTVATGVAMTPFGVTEAGYPTPVPKVSGLPSGLTFVSGMIQGTPKTTGIYAVTITAKNKAGITTQAFTMTVAPSVGPADLDQPTAITEDQGLLWITNVGNNSVTEMTLSGTVMATLSGPTYGFNDPVAIAGNGPDVYVVNAGGSVTVINATSDAAVQIIQGSNFGFSDPTALTLTASDAWVVNSGGNSVTEISLATGSLVQILSNATNSAYHFDDPDAISVVGSNLWVVNATGGSTTDPLAGSATVINGTTGSFTQLVESASDGMESPAGVAYGGGYVWITDSAGYQITQLTTSGALVQVITNSSNNGNYGFDHPTAVVAYGAKVYVDNPPGSSPMITQVDTATSDGDWFECNTNVPDPDFDNPTGLVVTGADVWVVSPADNTLTELDIAEDGQAINWFT